MRVELQTLHASIESTKNAQRSWTSRCSVRLVLSDGAGHVGVGEAAPLEGMSPDCAMDARRALAALDWPAEPPISLADIQAVVDRIDPRLPSARFAAETALASLSAFIQDLPLWALYVDEVEAQPLAASLLGGDSFSIRRAAREAAAYQVGAVKVKVGVSSPGEEAEFLSELRAILGPVELRLDANRALPFDGLEERLARLAEYEPAFLEEPCDLAALAALGETPFPIAVDESLAGVDPEAALRRALEIPSIEVVVLKPSLLGGIAVCRRMAETARAAGRRVVVSHLLEGSIARAAAAHLALVLGGEAAGLGDHSALTPLSDGLAAHWIDLGWIEPPQRRGLALDLAW